LAAAVSGERVTGYRRGQLQEQLTSWTDLGFWLLEKAIIVGAIGYAADATRNGYVGALYLGARILLMMGGYIRFRQVAFARLDADQKAARTPNQSLTLAPRSITPLIFGLLLVYSVDFFVGIMRTPAAH
jgi:hypothetical protein